MVKSCLGERLKKVYFSPYFTYQRAFFSRWPSQTAIGGIRNLEESSGIWRNPPDSEGIRSKYRNSCPAGIPAKIPVKAKKQEFL
jgi:hypothetical protein